MIAKNREDDFRIFCIVVLYHPSLEDVARRLSIIKRNVDRLFVWDNTPDGHIDEIDSTPVRGNGQNIGLAGAYNEGLKVATNEGYDYFLTMDQDTEWEGSMEEYITNIKEYEKNAPQRYKSLFFVRSFFDTTQYDELYNEILYGGINSGALIPIKFLNDIGGYPTYFFVDALDDYLQLSATKNGLKNIRVCGDCCILQSYGNPKRANFLGKKFYTYNYSAERYYSILRNYAILLRRFHTPRGFKTKYVKTFLFTNIAKILLGETDKTKKILSILHGAYDGFFKYKDINLPST